MNLQLSKEKIYENLSDKFSYNSKTIIYMLLKTKENMNGYERNGSICLINSLI